MYHFTRQFQYSSPVSWMKFPKDIRHRKALCLAIKSDALTKGWSNIFQSWQNPGSTFARTEVLQPQGRWVPEFHRLLMQCAWCRVSFVIATTRRALFHTNAGCLGSILYKNSEYFLLITCIFSLYYKTLLSPFSYCYCFFQTEWLPFDIRRQNNSLILLREKLNRLKLVMWYFVR